MKKRAAFLDKDGTLIPDIPYNIEPEKIIIEKEVIEGLKLLTACGYLIIVISNQPGIAMGIISEEGIERVRLRIEQLLRINHISLVGFYYCPHDEIMQCNCRKPLPGMIVQAARDHNISLEDSWMIGDILNDVEAGNRAGCKTILIDNGNETEWLAGEFRLPAYIAADMNEAAEHIISQPTTNELESL